MGLSSRTTRQETALAEPWRSPGTKRTEFFSADQLEASARRTQCVQRAAKITGKRFLALVTLGRGRAPKPTWAHLAAKAAPVEQPVAGTPAALPQRRNERAGAVLRDLSQTAVPQFHTADPGCAEPRLAACGRVPSAESPGCGLPESRKAQVPGAGGRGAQAGAKIQLVGDSQSPTFEHVALLPWNSPDTTYVETVGELAQPPSVVWFALGSCNLAAVAKIAAAQASFLSRLPQQTPWREVVGGRPQLRDFSRGLAHETRSLLEQAVVRGAREPVAARLMGVRLPEALGTERRRHARAVAKTRGATPAPAQLPLLAWNLFLTNVPAMVGPPQTVWVAYALSWPGELGVKPGKRGLP